jgi:hypothetical protein
MAASALFKQEFLEVRRLGRDCVSSRFVSVHYVIVERASEKRMRLILLKVLAKGSAHV